MWQQFQCQRQFYINRLHRKLCSLMVRKVSFFQQSLFFIIVLIMATKACYVWRRMTSSPVFTGRLRPWAASGVRENSRFLSAGFLVKLGNQQFFADYELQHSYNSLLCSRLVVGYNSNPACWPIPCFLSLRPYKVYPNILLRILWGFSKVYNGQVSRLGLAFWGSIRLPALSWSVSVWGRFLPFVVWATWGGRRIGGASLGYDVHPSLLSNPFPVSLLGTGFAVVYSCILCCIQHIMVVLSFC